MYFYNVVNAIEELIYQKKQNVRYRRQEADRFYQEINKEEQDIAALEAELEELKKKEGRGVFTP